MSRKKTKTNRQSLILDSFIYESVLNTNGTSSVDFPYATLCANIMTQAERDYQRYASSYDYSGMAKIIHEIKYPGGLVSNILAACNCGPDVYIARLKHDHPVGCDTPMRGRGAKP